MKTKFLILALTNAILSLGNFSQAQQSMPFSAENKMVMIENVPDTNAAIPEQKQDANVTNTENAQLAAEVQLHLQVALHLQEFFESRENDEKICSETPQNCDYETSFITSAVVD